MIAFGGTLAALALLAVGLVLLPTPEVSSAGGIFATLWLLVTAISVLAFGRELWRLQQLSRIRGRWLRSTKQRRRCRPAGSLSRVTYLRERERRLD